MSCAPFSNPLDNALSYLYTNKVIDENLNVKSNRYEIYINTLNKQAGGTLFTVANRKLIVNKELLAELNKNTLGRDEDLLETKDIKDNSYKLYDTLEMDGNIWKDSNTPLPKGIKEEDLEYIEKLYQTGVLQLDCL